MAVIAGVESRKWWRQFLTKEGLPHEHLHASTTNDDECFFSILLDSVGKDFTLKEVWYDIGHVSADTNIHNSTTSQVFLWMEEGHSQIHKVSTS